MGHLDSAHECDRPSLLDCLFAVPPLPAAIVVVIVVAIVVVIVVAIVVAHPLTISNIYDFC